ncbi:hypothetical protein BFP97_03160 [Roseivirga sp. 4D4]|uniref:hypothetical protein n=1 Tax=Roseivirga sp. 4D4 TaxID=1889784 RepID=UPI000852D47F|nr:hypothetical protein [Roseivirga sp. 4D4]OEK00565.1 hypothetical protein BFP97_03160 [Roseivirga sp. 4D4]
MGKLSKIFGVLILLFFGLSTVVAQDTNTEETSKVTKRMKRQQAKKDKTERKISYNAKKLVQLIEKRDVVVMDDGVGRGLYPESGLVNFFRIKGDTLTFQRMGADALGTGIQSDPDIFKKKGIIFEYQVLDSEQGRPRRIFLRYRELLSLEPFQVLIFVHANRFEVRNDDGSGVLIRGKLASNEDANVLEIGQNSTTLLLEQRLWRNGRRKRDGEGRLLTGWRGGQ